MKMPRFWPGTSSEWREGGKDCHPDVNLIGISIFKTCLLGNPLRANSRSPLQQEYDSESDHRSRRSAMAIPNLPGAKAPASLPDEVGLTSPGDPPGITSWDVLPSITSSKVHRQPCVPARSLPALRPGPFLPSLAS